MSLLAQVESSGATTFLDRFDSGQLFGLSCTVVAISAAVVIIVSFLAFATIRSIRLTHARTRFVQSMLEQGLSPDEITQLSTVAFGSSMCRRRINRTKSSVTASVPPQKQLPVGVSTAKPALHS